MVKTAQAPLLVFGTSVAFIQEVNMSLDMFKQSRLLALFILPLGLIVMTKSGLAQEKVSLEIGNVSKNESQAKKSADGRSSLVPISFEWKFKSTVAAKLVELVATIETNNTGGSKSRGGASIKDGTSNTVNVGSFDLQGPGVISPRDFKLTLRGKFRIGDSPELIDISEVKTGSFK